MRAVKSWKCDMFESKGAIVAAIEPNSPEHPILKIDHFISVESRNGILALVVGRHHGDSRAVGRILQINRAVAFRSRRSIFAIVKIMRAGAVQVTSRTESEIAAKNLEGRPGAIRFSK